MRKQDIKSFEPSGDAANNIESEENLISNVRL
jgi:hypothetical protein